LRTSWLRAIYDIAAPIWEAARLDHEPPSIVERAHEAVRWLSQAIVDVDQDAPEATAAIVEALGRILALSVFADVARLPPNEVTYQIQRHDARVDADPVSPKQSSGKCWDGCPVCSDAESRGWTSASAGECKEPPGGQHESHSR
jgi:hypothetical protein